VLILSRKPGQSIVIGGIIEITVAEVRGDQVRLGITAPRSVPVFRTEVLLQQGRPSPNGPQPENLMELLTRSSEGCPPPKSADEATEEGSGETEE
jgi:carbon storage regulator CsrA